MDRREMLQKSLMVAGSFCLCRSAGADDPHESTCCITPEIEKECLTFKENSLIIDLDKTSTLQKSGQTVYVDYLEKDVKMIMVREKKNGYYALSRLCTHGGPAPTDIRSYEIISGNNSLEILI